MSLGISHETVSSKKTRGFFSSDLVSQHLAKEFFLDRGRSGVDKRVVSKRVVLADVPQE